MRSTCVALFYRGRSDLADGFSLVNPANHLGENFTIELNDKLLTEIPNAFQTWNEWYQSGRVGVAQPQS